MLFVHTYSEWFRNFLLNYICINIITILGKTVLVVAHANSLRGVVKYIDDLSEEQITRVGIPNGIPLIFKFKVHGGIYVPLT